MGVPITDRVPYAPLAAAVGPVWARQNDSGDQFRASHPDYAPPRCTGVRERWQEVKGTPNGVLAELTGINRRTLTRWVKDGIPRDRADDMAIAIGMHPSEIWTDWYDADLVSLDA